MVVAFGPWPAPTSRSPSTRPTWSGLACTKRERRGQYRKAMVIEQFQVGRQDMKTCPECNGDGVIEKGTDDEEQCPRCGGSGFVPDDHDDVNDDEITRTSASTAGARYGGR